MCIFRRKMMHVHKKKKKSFDQLGNHFPIDEGFFLIIGETSLVIQHSIF